MNIINHKEEKALDFLLNTMFWTFALYGLFEFIKNIIFICVHTKLIDEGIYLIIAVRNKENSIEGFVRSLMFKIIYGKEENIKDVIVTDLNSKDNTNEILNRLSKEYECINKLKWKDCKELIDNIENVE